MLTSWCLRAALVGAITVGTGGCALDVEEEEVTESAQSGIVGGSATSAQPAVGAIIWFAEKRFCSAFLVAPRIVMTAAHCVQGQRVPDGFFVGPGNRETKPRASMADLDNFTRYPVEAKAVHPSYDPNAGNLTTLSGTMLRFRNDVALLRLKGDLSTITPLKVAGSPAPVGTTCTAIGYGFDAESGTLGGLRKRSASVKVASVSTHNIEVKAVTGEPAKGDSGSPLLCSGTVRGVLSFYYWTNTTSNDRDFYQRTSEMRSWANTVATKWGVGGLS